MKKFNKKSKIAVLGALASLALAGLVIAATAVSLGTADSFAVLGGSGITNTGATTITGDIGTYPTTTITGGPTVVGTNHAGDATTQSAKTDLVTAYNNAAGQTPVTTVPTELGATTKTAGIYDSAAGTFGITGTLTLDALGDANAVFIFKTASTLITGGSSVVTLVNGAQACNVFWQVGSSATLGTNSTFKGNILALTSITLTTGANVEGSLLAQNGAVTLDTNIVTKSTCVVPPPAPVVSSNAGGSTFSLLPLINVTKVPSPLSLPGGPGPVTYTYLATNLGPVSMSGVWVKDDKCAPLKYISGDTNSNDRLGTTETWKYECTKVVSKTETNTATAHGFYNGWDTYDNANATVVVKAPAPIVPPLIHLVKKPSTFVLPARGGAVTYMYTVTNPGTAPLSDVSVIDDKCTGLPGRIVGHPGDLNQNNLLENNEVWSFVCQTNLTKTTTNVGTAEGHANGLTAIDFSPSTVVVAAVKLPTTGFQSEEGNGALWGTAAVGGALMISLLSLMAMRKRRV